MFFESENDLRRILKNSSAVVLAMQDGDRLGDEKFDLKKFFSSLGRTGFFEPEGSRTSRSSSFYSIDQMHEVRDRLATAQLEDVWIVFDHAEGFRENSENAILKMIEEPGERVHFVFLTTEPKVLLPTILSRAAVYIPRQDRPLDQAPGADPKTLDAAKRLLVADQKDVAKIADELMKKKEDVRREFAAGVIGAAVELAYRSYFKTGRKAFADRIPPLIEAYENISGTGCSIRLQLIAAFVKI